MEIIATIDLRASLESIFEENQFTIARLRAEPIAMAFAGVFEAFEVEWWAVFREEKALVAGIYNADALIDRADQRLYSLADAIGATLLLDLENNRRAPGFIRYFGTQKASDFRHPIIRGQLETMRTWPPSLETSPNPLLQKYATELVDAIERGDAAKAAGAAADKKLLDFRTSGRRKVFIDQYNSLRKSTFSELSKIAQDHPEMNLPPDFAVSFFRHEDEPRTMALYDLLRRLKVVAAEHSRLQALYDAKAKQEEADAKLQREMERAMKQAEIEAAESLIAEMTERKTALAAELEQDTAP